MSTFDSRKEQVDKEYKQGHKNASDLNAFEQAVSEMANDVVNAFDTEKHDAYEQGINDGRSDRFDKSHK